MKEQVNKERKKSYEEEDEEDNIEFTAGCKRKDVKGSFT